MINRKYHITRLLIITSLMMGLLAHLLVPLSSQAQKTAFTRWLDKNVVSSGNDSEIRIRNTIKELPEQAGDFWGLVQEASELVAKHKDQFKLPVSQEKPSRNQQESTWLIDQWNQFQNQESGFNSVLIETAKTLSKWIPQNGDTFSLYRDLTPQRSHYFDQLFFNTIQHVVFIFHPLSSGISINAP